jgi:hypothetical protein
MKKLLFLWLFVLCIYSPNAISQSNQSIADKYWTYRDRFRKNFIKIGDGQGESIPACARRVQWAHGADQTNSALYWSDATIYLGHYLQVLATEYKLLADQGLDATATLNELYYALRAVNRLDQVAEPYLYNNSQEAQQINGLMLRDDVPPLFFEHFTQSYSAVFNVESPTLYVHSDYSPLNNYASEGPIGENQVYNDENVQSLDQLLDIFTGLYMVYKLVPNITIQPPTEQAIQVHEYLTNIIIRIYYRLENDAYIITMPGGTEAVPRGFWCLPQAPAFKKVAYELIGGKDGYEDWLHNAMGYSFGDAEEIAEDNVISLSNVPSLITHEGITGAWQALESGGIVLSNDGFCTSGTLIDEFCIFENVLNEDNIHIAIQTAILGELWSPDFVYINSALPENGFYWYPMLYEVMHGESSLFSNNLPSFISNLLLDAPCEGPWGDPNYTNITDPGANAPNGWASQNLLFHPDNALYGPDERSFRGEYSGLDYMLYHNLYQLVYGNADMSNTNACPCVNESGGMILNEEVVFEPAHPDYKTKQIPIPSYITQSILFENQDVVVKNDLTICSANTDNPTLVEFNATSSLFIHPGNTITLKNGSSIYLHQSIIKVVNPTEQSFGSAKIILEPGTSLFIDEASALELDSHLEIIVKENAQLQFVNSAISLQVPTQLLTINVRESGHLALHSTNISQDFGAAAWITSQPNALIEIDNCSGLTNNWDLTNSGSQTSILNSNFTFNNVDFEFDNNASLYIETSDLSMAGGQINFDNGAQFFCNESFLQLSNNAHMTMSRTSENAAPSAFHFNMSQLDLIGNNTKIHLDGGELHVADNSMFQPKHENQTSGFIEISGVNDHEIFLGNNSSIILEGDGANDLMLKIINGAELWLDSPSNIFKIKNAFVNLGGNGKIWTNSIFEVINSEVSDAFNDASSAEINTWINSGKLINSQLMNVKLVNNFNNVLISQATFNQQNGGVYQRGGTLTVNSSIFNNCGIFTRQLNGLAQVRNCSFNGLLLPEQAAINDISQSEYFIEACTFNNYEHAIKKRFGLLSLRCNSFDGNNTAILHERGVLSMSSGMNTGYNNFTANKTNIRINNAVDIHLDRGYNNLQDFAEYAIVGSLAKSCGKSCTDLIVPANRNYWSTPMMSGINVITTAANPLCGNVNCPVVFEDASPTLSNTCPVVKPFPKPLFRNHISADNQLFSSSRSETDSDSLILVNLPSIGLLPLDSALGIAASNTILYDSLANDEVAVDIIHELYMNNDFLSNTEFSEVSRWTTDLMKSSIETLFANGTCNVNGNRVNFQPSVQKYVDVLNLLTTESSADSLVSTQFYIELNKGQLFRTIQKPEIAQLIFQNLDDCSLDSLEQASVNYWLQKVSEEINTYQEYYESETPIVIAFTTDSISNEDLEVLNLPQYKFGVYIHNPRNVSFVNCFQYFNGRELTESTIASGLYPNPNNGTFAVFGEFPYDQRAHVRVFDPMGRLVYNERVIPSQENKLSISLPVGLSPGNYFLSIETEGRLIQQAIQVQ